MYHQQQQQQQQMSSALLRYRSAPSALFGEACEEFIQASPEAIFARPLAADLGDRRFPSTSQMLYQSQQQHDTSDRVADSIAMEAERLNLIRHRSSPAGLFSHLNVQRGYGEGTTRGMTGFEPAGILAANRLKAQISFSEIGGVSNNSNSSSSSPEESSLASLFANPLISDGFSGSREIDGKLVHGLNQSEHQNGQLMSSVSGLSSSDMTTIEKFLQCQDSVPCKIRAKRGFATHPRSIAERVRRTRISERMRKLQELVPNMDKQTNTADMLDLAVEYINNLQQEVKGLSDSQASCTCSSSKKKPYSRPTA